MNKIGVIRFRNHFDVDLTTEKNDGTTKMKDNMVLTNKELMNKFLRGGEITKYYGGQYLNNDHDSIDVDKIPLMDVNDLHQNIMDIGELTSVKEAEYKKQVEISAKSKADKALQERNKLIDDLEQRLKEKK